MKDEAKHFLSICLLAPGGVCRAKIGNVLQYAALCRGIVVRIWGKCLDFATVGAAFLVGRVGYPVWAGLVMAWGAGVLHDVETFRIFGA